MTLPFLKQPSDKETKDSRNQNIPQKSTITADNPKTEENAKTNMDFTIKETTVNWEITPSVEYDELPSDEFMREVDAIAGVANYLSSSEERIKEIAAYVRGCKIESIPAKDIPQYTPQQYFIVEEKAYPLNEDQCKYIDEMLNDLTTSSTVNQVLGKDKIKLYTFAERIINALEKEGDLPEMYKDIQAKNITKLALKVFALTSNNKLQEMIQDDVKYEKDKFIFLLNKTCTIIGNLIIETYMYKNILYPVTTPQIEVETSKYKKVKEHQRVTNEQINDMLTSLKKVENKNEILKITEAYLKLYAADKNIINAIPIEIDSELKIILQKEAQKLGMRLIDILAKAEIIKHTKVNLAKDKTNIPHIILNIDFLEEILIAPLSFNVPKVGKSPRPEYQTITDNEKIDLKITTNKKSTIFFTPNTDKIITTPKNDEIKKAYNEIPHAVNKKVYSNILLEFQELLSAEISLNDENLKQFVKSVYFIDLEPLIKENKTNSHNMVILKDIISLGIELNNQEDAKLKEKVKHHEAFNNLYNKITAYKIIIKGLLNHCNLFCHFAYFYIDKEEKSTGRSFSEPFYMQLQGYKLATALIDFYPIASLDDSSYNKFITIVKRVIPEITIPSQIINNFKEYQQQNNNLYLKQLLALFTFKEASNFEQYTTLNKIKDKVIWLGTHIKKPKEIWLACNLLDAYIDNTYLQTTGQKQDATSSAIQHIGCLRNNYNLCKQSNIVGKEYHDIYLMYAQLLNADRKQILNTLNDLIKPIIEKFNKGNLNEKIIYDLITNDISWNKQHNDPNVNMSNLIENDKNILKTLYDIRFPAIGFGNFHNRTKDTLKTVLNLIREYIEAEKLFSIVPENLLTNRNITKKVIMTKGYNAGREAGITSIFDYLVESLQNLGQPFINKLQLKQLSVIIYNLIEPHLSQNLSALTAFSDTMCNFVKEQIAQNKIPIKITTPYIAWTYSKHDISTLSRNTIKSTSRKDPAIKFALFQHQSYSKDQMLTGFASVFVHSCDAFVVQDIIYNINKINIECRKHNIPEIRMTFNHDCYTVSSQHAILLQSIVRVSYNKVHLMRKQIPQLDKNVSNLSPIKVSNPHFLRY